MKQITIAAGLALAAAITYGLATQARAAGSGQPDPVKVDPKHYKVEFENDSVRVLRVSYAPGERSVMHGHPNSVAVYLTGGTARMTTPDGKSEDRPVKAGAAVWTPAATHLPRNIGAQPLEVILVELKK